MLTAVVIVLYMGVSLTPIFLHGGRGGGLSDMFKGGMGSAAAGSHVVECKPDRITVAVAVVLAFTPIILEIRLQ